MKQRLARHAAPSVRGGAWPSACRRERIAQRAERGCWISRARSCAPTSANTQAHQRAGRVGLFVTLETWPIDGLVRASAWGRRAGSAGAHAHDTADTGSGWAIGCACASRPWTSCARGSISSW
jgi:hypothetical protein